MKYQQGQNYMRKQAKDYRNIDSRKQSNQYAIKSFGIVSNGKRKPVFPLSFSLGFLGIVQNN